MAQQDRMVLARMAAMVIVVLVVMVEREITLRVALVELAVALATLERLVEMALSINHHLPMAVAEAEVAAAWVPIILQRVRAELMEAGEEEPVLVREVLGVRARAVLSSSHIVRRQRRQRPRLRRQRQLRRPLGPQQRLQPRRPLGPRPRL